MQLYWLVGVHDMRDVARETHPRSVGTRYCCGQRMAQPAAHITTLQRR